MNYSFSPYNPLYPELFKKEKSYLQQVIGKDIVIEHFGSTAVPGLGGKGVIDKKEITRVYMEIKGSVIQEIMLKAKNM